MMFRGHVGRRWVVWGNYFAVGLLLLGSGACVRPVSTESAALAAPDTGNPDLRLWSEGKELFFRGDYEGAMALFFTLSESARDPAMSRKGLFGLAAARLALAKSASELDEAMMLLDCWSEIAPAEMESEDPRFLLPALDRFSGFGLREGSQPQRQRSKKDFLYGSLQTCKNALKLKEKEMDRMKSRLDSKDREIRKLRSQIESLEAIDRKFQEKKREAANP